MYVIDRNQGETPGEYTFGYVVVGDGGLFFAWKYDPDAHYYDQVRQVVDTLDEDTIDPPTGRWSHAVVERSLRHHIARHGLMALPE